MSALHIYAPIYVSNKSHQPKMHQHFFCLHPEHVLYYLQDMMCSSLVQI
jgi:hypothetical protein